MKAFLDEFPVSAPGTTFTVEDIPTGAEELSVYAWDGLRKSIPLNGDSSITIRDLTPGETYMFFVELPD